MPLDLAKGERVLSAAPTGGGSYVVATTAALHLPVDEGGGLRRLPWERVDHATWNADRLHVTEEGGRNHQIRLTDPGTVPETVRERVTATILVNRPAVLPGGGRIRITGRRPPGGTEVRWTILFDSGLDPGDPELRAQAQRILTELRRQTGL